MAQDNTKEFWKNSQFENTTTCSIVRYLRVHNFVLYCKEIEGREGFKMKIYKYQCKFIEISKNLTLHPFLKLRKKKWNDDKNETVQISCGNGPGRSSLLKHPENLALQLKSLPDFEEKKWNDDKNETVQISCRNGLGRIKIMTHHFHKYGGRR